MLYSTVLKTKQESIHLHIPKLASLRENNYLFILRIAPRLTRVTLEVFDTCLFFVSLGMCKITNDKNQSETKCVFFLSCIGRVKD